MYEHCIPFDSYILYILWPSTRPSVSIWVMFNHIITHLFCLIFIIASQYIPLILAFVFHMHYMQILLCFFVALYKYKFPFSAVNSATNILCLGSWSVPARSTRQHQDWLPCFFQLHYEDDFWWWLYLPDVAAAGLSGPQLSGVELQREALIAQPHTPCGV